MMTKQKTNYIGVSGDLLPGFNGFPWSFSPGSIGSNTKNFSHVVGNKEYELTNHLGNVIATVSDRKMGKVAVSGKYTSYEPKIISSQDYMPFGMLMPGRNYQSDQYKFGMNGQMKDDQINNISGSHYTALFWEYDALTGRRWNLDRVTKPWQSPYACFSNNSILNTDPLGNFDDKFDLDNAGIITRTGPNDDKSDTHDYLTSKKTKETLQLDNGILDKKESNSYQIPKSKEPPINYDVLKVTGDDKATDLFKFLSQGSDVEWSQSSVGESSGDKGINYISTSHDEGTEKGGTVLFNTTLKDESYREHKHSHTNNTSYISTGDQNFADQVQTRSPNAKMFLFRPMNCKLIEYNCNTVPGSLPEVDINN